MKVLIFGATGFSGKAILAEALSKNHQVTILVRNAQAVTLQDKNLNVVEGSVLDKNTVNAVLPLARGFPIASEIITKLYS